MGCGLEFPLNASSVSVPGTERLTSKRACDRRHDVVIWLSVLRPRPHLQAAPLRDLGHLEVTRAARDRIQLAKRLAGLIPGGERFPGARFPLHTAPRDQPPDPKGSLAQNTLVCTTPLLTGIGPTSAPNGGYRLSSAPKARDRACCMRAGA